MFSVVRNIFQKMPVIKISKKVDFPSNLTPADIIADIEASEPNDPLFEKSAELFETEAHNKKTEDFQKLCKVIDEEGFRSAFDFMWMCLKKTPTSNENLVEANHVNSIYDETKEIIEKLIADREDTQNKT